MIEPVVPIAARFFDVERFTSKFVPLFKRESGSEPKPEDRTWTLVESCKTSLDMLKAAVLFNQRYPKVEKAEIQDIRNWLDSNKGPLDRSQIISGLNYFFCGINREAPEITSVELIEAAYHFNNQALCERLKIEFRIRVYTVLARKNIIEVIRLLKEIEASLFDLKWASDKLAEFLGRKLIDSKDRQTLVIAYISEGVPKLSFNTSFGGSFTIDDEVWNLLGEIHSLRALDFVGVQVRFNKLPRKLSSLTVCGLKNDDKNRLNSAPIGLKSLIIDSSDIDSDFFIGMPPLIEKLAVTNCEMIDDKLVEYLPIGLTHLDVSGCRLISDQFLCKVPDSLKSLTLRNLFSITDVGLSHISAMGLTFLCIAGTLITDNGLLKIPNSVTHLVIGERATDKGLFDLSLKLKGLLSLDLRDNKSITRRGLSALPKTVTDLNLSGTNITDEDMGSLPLNLIALNLCGSKVNKPLLPIGLLNLNVYQTYASDLDYLRNARCLMHFSANYIKTNDLSLIPRNVLNLTLDFSQINNLDQLPPHLLILNISFCRMLKVEELSKVPKTVRLVDITDTSFDLATAKSYLPQECVIINGTEIHVV